MLCNTLIALDVTTTSQMRLISKIADKNADCLRFLIVKFKRLLLKVYKNDKKDLLDIVFRHMFCFIMRVTCICTTNS